MNRRQESQLIKHLNRIFIAGLSFAGMLLDGLQCADVVMELAVILWLWMPECLRLEITALGRARRPNMSDSTVNACR